MNFIYTHIEVITVELYLSMWTNLNVSAWVACDSAVWRELAVSWAQLCLLVNALVTTSLQNNLEKKNLRRRILCIIFVDWKIYRKSLTDNGHGIQFRQVIHQNNLYRILLSVDKCHWKFIRYWYYPFCTLSYIMIRVVAMN